MVKFNSLLRENDLIKNLIIKDIVPSSKYVSVQFVFTDKQITFDNIHKSIVEVLNSLNLSNTSLHVTRPGYFGFGTEPSRRTKLNEMDFEIYCPNPDCSLNKEVRNTP